MDKRYLRLKEASGYLGGISLPTLYRMHSSRRYPFFTKVEGTVLFDSEEFQKWQQKQNEMKIEGQEFMTTSKKAEFNFKKTPMPS